jgi:hypothetical protein
MFFRKLAPYETEQLKNDDYNTPIHSNAKSALSLDLMLHLASLSVIVGLIVYIKCSRKNKDREQSNLEGRTLRI